VPMRLVSDWAWRLQYQSCEAESYLRAHSPEACCPKHARCRERGAHHCMHWTYLRGRKPRGGRPGEGQVFSNDQDQGPYQYQYRLVPQTENKNGLGLQISRPSTSSGSLITLLLEAETPVISRGSAALLAPSNSSPFRHREISADCFLPPPNGEGTATPYCSLLSIIPRSTPSRKLCILRTGVLVAGALGSCLSAHRTNPAFTRPTSLATTAAQASTFAPPSADLFFFFFLSHHYYFASYFLSLFCYLSPAEEDINSNTTT
jgi:hypothetical protein